MATKSKQEDTKSKQQEQTKDLLTTNLPKLRIKRLTKDLPLPTKGTTGSACYDLYASEYKVIKNINVEKPTVIGTGVVLDIPEGYHVKIYLRSSTGLTHRVRLANGTGIIDSDYKGEVKLILENNSREVVYVNKGQRIAQFLLERNVDFELEEVDEIVDPQTHEGFGSTGK